MPSQAWQTLALERLLVLKVSAQCELICGCRLSGERMSASNGPFPFHGTAGKKITFRSRRSVSMTCHRTKWTWFQFFPKCSPAFLLMLLSGARGCALTFVGLTACHVTSRNWWRREPVETNAPNFPFVAPLRSVTRCISWSAERNNVAIVSHKWRDQVRHRHGPVGADQVENELNNTQNYILSSSVSWCVCARQLLVFCWIFAYIDVLTAPVGEWLTGGEHACTHQSQWPRAGYLWNFLAINRSYDFCTVFDFCIRSRKGDRGVAQNAVIYTMLNKCWKRPLWITCCGKTAWSDQSWNWHLKKSHERGNLMWTVWWRCN